MRVSSISGNTSTHAAVQANANGPEHSRPARHNRLLTVPSRSTARSLIVEHATSMTASLPGPHKTSDCWQSGHPSKHAAVPAQVDCGACRRFLLLTLALLMPVGNVCFA